jgi:hypothetical protein
MMKNCILILCVLLSLGATAQRKSRNLNESPEVVDPPRTGHAIGGVLSSTNGNGLAYRYWPRKTGVHISCLPLVTSSSSFYSVGTTIYHTLREYRSNNKLFLQAGLDFVHQEFEGSYWSGRDDYSSNSYNVGVGPGFESHTRYGSFSAYLGYGIYQKTYTQYLDNKNVFTLSGGISYFFEI